MNFIRRQVLIRKLRAPEEIVSEFTGGFGQYQVLIIIVAFMAELIHGVDLYCTRTASPSNLNFTCKNGNGSRCFASDGSPCREFIFDAPYKTFTQLFNLVCGKERLIVWSEHCHRLGLILGSVLTGISADKLGLKVAAMIFLALHCLTGLLTIIMRRFEVLIIFDFFSGFCTSVMFTFPKIAVCETVGNKWRTLALGCAGISLPIAMLFYQSAYIIFPNIIGVMTLISLLPLALLIPLLYYKDSLNYNLMLGDFSRGEDVLRQIARSNKQPIPETARLLPIRFLSEERTGYRSSYCLAWATSETRTAFSIVLLNWLFAGICVGFLMHFIFGDMIVVVLYATSSILGFVLSIILCHYIQHKYICCVFWFLICGVNIAVFLGGTQHLHYDEIVFISLKLITGFITWCQFVALDNLTPRMFPTEMRGFLYGCCLAVFHCGYLVATELAYATKLSWIGALLATGCALAGTVSSHWLWNVHNRELPDFLYDCVHFVTQFKPVRYILIFERGQREIEVECIELNRTIKDQ